MWGTASGTTLGFIILMCSCLSLELGFSMGFWCRYLFRGDTFVIVTGFVGFCYWEFMVVMIWLGCSYVYAAYVMFVVLV